MRTLTIGILTCDDFDGLYFTIQSLRIHHPEAMGRVKFLILDNSPDGSQQKANEDLMKWIKEPVVYLRIDGNGTALRNHLFELADTKAVLCLDSHVILEPGSLRKLIDYLDDEQDDGNLLQGPLIYDDLRNLATHFEPVWRDHMWGIWASDPRGRNIDAEPFEIPAQGLGLFCCRTETWPSFNDRFRGFGGEECYIHEKMRQQGRKTLCLPFLRWMHRFRRPTGCPYPLKLEDRVWNYLIGHFELGLDPAPVLEHFCLHFPPARLAAMATMAAGLEIHGLSEIDLAAAAAKI